MFEALESLPIISLILVTLPIGAGLIWLVDDRSKARWIALATALVDLALSLTILAGFDASSSDFQFVEHRSWIPTLEVNYHVGVDGISVLFLPLTVTLFIGIILASWNSVQSMPRLYYTLLLLLESVTLGIFCALDTILFFLFWELTLIPIYFLISLWGVGPYRRYAAVKYTLYMMAGGIPLLFAFILLAFNHAQDMGGVPAGLSFDYTVLFSTPVSAELQVVIFFLLLLGFAVKVPIFPFHTWLPTVAMEGSAGIAAMMTGIKLGAYGLIRFLLPLAPDAAQRFHWLLAGLGVVGMIYGALAAMAQTNLRRMLAYASVSHIGLVVLGIASMNQQGIQGALFQLLNFTIVSGGLFLLAGFLHQRIGSTETISLGGVAKTMPLMSAFFLLFGLAAMGLPGTNGFPAELLIILSALKTHTGSGLAALVTMVLGAAYFLRLFRKTFQGPVVSPAVADAQDLLPREMIVVLTLAFLVFLFGLFPSLILDLTRETTTAWVQHLGSASP